MSCVGSPSPSTTTLATYHSFILTKLHSFVNAASTAIYGITRLRTYKLPEKPDFLNPTICEAALATSAANSLLEPVNIGSQQFVDAALGANNPVDKVEREASNMWCPETGDLKNHVKCFVPIGTGKVDFLFYGPGRVIIYKL